MLNVKASASSNSALTDTSSSRATSWRKFWSGLGNFRYQLTRLCSLSAHRCRTTGKGCQDKKVLQKSASKKRPLLTFSCISLVTFLTPLLTGQSYERKLQVLLHARKHNIQSRTSYVFVFCKPAISILEFIHQPPPSSSLQYNSTFRSVLRLAILHSLCLVPVPGLRESSIVSVRFKLHCP